jgi:Protein of unknown function (DUF5818)
MVTRFSDFRRILVIQEESPPTIAVKGCLQGSHGNYTLMADNGTTYQLQGDTSKLSAHIGHEVQITGSTKLRFSC